LEDNNPMAEKILHTHYASLHFAATHGRPQGRARGGHTILTFLEENSMFLGVFFGK